jgi:hypothetical protein
MTTGSLSALNKGRRRQGYQGLPRKGTKDTWGCKEILQQHHEDLKDDPERLSTKFIADVAGCSCRIVKKKMSEGEDVA